MVAEGGAFFASCQSRWKKSVREQAVALQALPMCEARHFLRWFCLCCNGVRAAARGGSWKRIDTLPYAAPRLSLSVPLSPVACPSLPFLPPVSFPTPPPALCLRPCSTTVFSHAQTVVQCPGCDTILCQPTGGKARLTEGCSFRKR